MYGELTVVTAGRLAGRTAGDELTVTDLAGPGLQDAAAAALTAQHADEHTAGHDVPPGNW